MNIRISLSAAAATLVLLSGCSGTSLMNRNRPDEMAVTREPPLIIPPDFALKPPPPGTAASQRSDAKEEALDAMFGGPALRSSGETSLLDQAGTAAPGIRSEAGDTKESVVDTGKTVFDIVKAPEGDGKNARAAVGTPTAS